MDVGAQRSGLTLSLTAIPATTRFIKGEKKKKEKKENTVFDTNLLSVNSNGPTYLMITAQQQ